MSGFGLDWGGWVEVEVEVGLGLVEFDGVVK